MDKMVEEYLNNVEKARYLDFDELDGATGLGTAKKKFTRCLGQGLQRMYKAFHSQKNHNFVTCIGSDIYEMTPEEFDNTYLSGIIFRDRKSAERGDNDTKTTSYADNPYSRAQLIGCRVANVLGLRTAYVAPVEGDKSRVISVDFLQNIQSTSNPSDFKSQRMETFNELTGTEAVGAKSYISQWMRLLTRTLSSEKCATLSQEKKDDIIVDFISLFLTKSLVLDDKDFNGGNVAFVHTGDYSDLSISAAFDYEYCLENESYIMEKYCQKPADFLDVNMAFLVQNYPEHTAKAMQKLHLTDNKKASIKGIFNEFGDNENWAHFWSNIVLKNIEKVNTTYAQMSQNTEMTYSVN